MEKKIILNLKEANWVEFLQMKNEEEFYELNTEFVNITIIINLATLETKGIEISTFSLNI